MTQRTSPSGARCKEQRCPARFPFFSFAFDIRRRDADCFFLPRIASVPSPPSLPLLPHALVVRCSAKAVESLPLSAAAAPLVCFPRLLVRSDKKKHTSASSCAILRPFALLSAAASAAQNRKSEGTQKEGVRSRASRMGATTKRTMGSRREQCKEGSEHVENECAKIRRVLWTRIGAMPALVRSTNAQLPLSSRR
jgi:hypothetical protein